MYQTVASKVTENPKGGSMRSATSPCQGISIGALNVSLTQKISCCSKPNVTTRLRLDMGRSSPIFVLPPFPTVVRLNALCHMHRRSSPSMLSVPSWMQSAIMRMRYEHIRRGDTSHTTDVPDRLESFPLEIAQSGPAK